MAKRAAPAEEEIVLPYEDGEPEDAEGLLAELRQRAPELVDPSGYYLLQRQASPALLGSVDTEKRTATFVIVTRDGSTNRQGNMVQITGSKYGAGMLTESYDQNPVVMFDHGFGGIALPIGLSSAPSGRGSVKKSAKEATATVTFSNLPHAEPVFAGVAEGILRMASVGYNPLKAMRVKQEAKQLAEGVDDLDRYRGLDFVESELLEWSITPIGADRGSLRQCIERGKIHDVRLPEAMRYSFQRAAGDRPAWSPGWEPTEPKPAVTPQAAAAPAPSPKPEPVAQTQTAVDPPPEIVTTPPVVLGPTVPVVQMGDLAQAFARRFEQPEKLVSVEQIVSLVAQRVDAVVNEKVGPILAKVQALDAELTRMSGRVA